MPRKAISPSKWNEIIDRAKAKALANDKNFSGCCQSVLLALQEEFGIGDVKSFTAATVLSAGLRRGESCGALMGALMSLGLVIGRDRIEDSDRYKKAMVVARELSRKFQEELKKQFGFSQKLETTLCKEIQEKILGRSFDFWTEYEAFLEAGGHSDTGCPKVCSIAAQVGAEKILEIRGKKLLK